MTWHQDQPYVELPELPPDVELETTGVLKAVIEARSALAQLDQATALIPNPTVLINTIPLLEAQASSEIENVVTTTDELFKHATTEVTAADSATKETLRYRTALYAGVADVRSRPLTANTAALVCTEIQLRQMDIRKLRGTRIINPATREVVYVPPEGEDVIRAKLANWERFVHTNDNLDPLVRMAVAHYQFEAIHPFDDGNGRTGRIINILMLIQAGLLRQPILYLSRYIIKTKADYYRLLRTVTSSATWEEWILYMVEGVQQTARSTLRKITAIRELQDDMQREIRALPSGGRHADFVTALFEQPYTRISTVMDRCEISRPTATTWLTTLVDGGVISDIRIGRHRLFVNDRLMEVLRRDEL